MGLVALAAVAGGVLFTLRNGPREKPPGDGESRLASNDSESQGSRPTITLEDVPVVEASSSKPTSRELPDGVWIRGRVVVPAGTPPDERVEVAARVLSFDDAPGYVAQVDDHGKFAVMFPRDVDSGWIEVHARYLVLQPNQEVDLEMPPEEIVLEPVLGGRVRGRIVARGRPESETRALAGTCVEISDKGGPGFRRFYPRKTCVGEDLGFEFLALPPCAGFELASKAKDFLPFEKVIEAPPGMTTEVEIDLHAGVRVSGRVLDPDGKPVVDAKVWRTEIPPREDPHRADADAMTGSDGSFSMHAIPPGEVAIAFKSRGCLREIVELGRLEDGDVREGVEVRLRTSLIHGRVEWPDGSPASGAVVELSASASLDPRTAGYWDRDLATAHKGQFRLEASNEGPFSLFARFPSQPDVDPEDPSGTSGSGVAVLEGVRPGTVPVVLVLEPGQSVVGRVTDDLGSPVTNFAVGGHRNQDRELYSIATSVRGEFDSPDGAFAFAGLTRGEWMFGASVEGRANRNWRRVELPNQGEPIVLVIPRGTTVSGIVVDPEGHPVAGAEVKSWPNQETPSDENGRFELSNLPPGRLQIWAEAPSFAPSGLILISVKPGESASEVRVVLRRGGAIECQVLDAEGNPEPGRGISVESRGANEGYLRIRRLKDETDEEGRIVFEDLAPGPYLLSKRTTDQENAGEMQSGPNLWTRFAASKTQASAVVVAGEVTRVVIGGPKGSSIRVRGRVTDGGAPVAGIEVGASTGTVEENDVERRTGTDGRFELLVDQPMDLELQLAFEESGTQLTTWRRVAGGSSDELDLILPRGRISGVVRSKDDRLLEGVALSIESEGIAWSLGAWTAGGGTTTASDGRFSFENLPGGRYELRTFDNEPFEGEVGTTTELFLEEGGRLEDVVIRLP